MPRIALRTAPHHGTRYLRSNGSIGSIWLENALEVRKGRSVLDRPFRCGKGRTLEWEQDIEHLLTIPGLLNIGQLPTSAVGNPCLRNLLMVDRVGRADVLGPHHTCDEKLTDLKVDTDFLPALDNEISVGKDLRYDRRYGQAQYFLTVDGSDALALTRRAQT